VSLFPGFEVWGLTGGIAAGKSQVAGLLVAAGIPVIDADLVARELSQPGGAAQGSDHSAYAEIVARFGTADRARLREIVFKDEAARRDLEAILHPRIVAESLRRMQQAAALAQASSHARLGARGVPLVVYEAALLVETGRYRDLDGLLVVDAPVELRLKRLVTRDGVAPELAERIIRAQATDEQRRAAATALIPNTGSLEELRAAVEAWVGQIAPLQTPSKR
jgi:dephospho-CoA kinase